MDNKLSISGGHKVKQTAGYTVKNKVLFIFVFH